MSHSSFRFLIAVLGIGFAVAFSIVVIPALIVNPNIVNAFAAGFVNPFSSGYAIDAISCWLILAVWVIYEAKAKGIKYGWVALLLGIAPGVATGLAAYLLMRLKQDPKL